MLSKEFLPNLFCTQYGNPKRRLFWFSVCRDSDFSGPLWGPLRLLLVCTGGGGRETAHPLSSVADVHSRKPSCSSA